MLSLSIGYLKCEKFLIDENYSNNDKNMPVFYKINFGLFLGVLTLNVDNFFLVLYVASNILKFTQGVYMIFHSYNFFPEWKN